MRYLWSVGWDSPVPRKKHEAQDLIMSTSRTEIRGNYGRSDSLGWQSHFLRAEIEPLETRQTMIKDCGREEFSERVWASWIRVGFKISRSRHAATRNPKRPQHFKNQPGVWSTCEASTVGPVVARAMRSGCFLNFLGDP